MKYIKNFFRKFSKRLAGIYISAFVLFISVMIFTVFVPFMELISIGIVTIITIIAILVYTPLIPVYSADRKNGFKINLGRMMYYLFIVVAANLACSYALSMVTFAIFGTALVAVNPWLAYFLATLVDLAVAILIISRITQYNGSNDTTHKRFNPHLILISVFLGHIPLIPVTWMNWNDGFLLNTQTLPAFFLSPLGAAGFFIGYPVFVLGLCAVLMFFYNKGRGDFFAKHPHDLEYDSEQVNEFIG